MRILAEKLRKKLDRLERTEDVIEEGLGDFQHELRRVGDALVRVGGRSLELDRRERQLRENIKLARKDLEKNRVAREKLIKRLSTLEREIGSKA